MKSSKSFLGILFMIMIQVLLACGSLTLNNANSSESPREGSNIYNLNDDIDIEPLEIAKIPKKIIVSDVDDTIKITEAGVNGRTLANLAYNSEYYGMHDVYSAFYNADSASREVMYVTAAPKLGFLDRLAVMFLAKYLFPTKENFYSRNSIWESIEAYKYKTIVNIIKDAHPDSKFIFIGDNGEKDVVVYKKITAEFPTRVLETFIHEVYLPDENKKQYLIDPEQKRYLTSADLAVNFYAKGYIDVQKASELILDLTHKYEEKYSYIITSWMRSACGDFISTHWPLVENAELKSKFEELRKQLYYSPECF